MEISLLGHASFRLYGSGISVVTDPYPEGAGFPADGRPADVVTVSSRHANHSAVSRLAGRPRVFSAPGEYEYRGVWARGAVTHLPEGWAFEDRNVAFTVEVDGVSVCHVGRLSRPLSTAAISALAPVHVLLAPVGPGSPLGEEGVHRLVQDVSPSVVIPMLVGDVSGLPGSGDPAAAFARSLGLTDVQAQSRLSVAPASLTGDLRVVVLQPSARP